MPGPPPKIERIRRGAPAGGEWKVASSSSWRFGATPEPPEGLLPASQDAWSIWFGARFAAHWTPSDLPALRQLTRLFDQVERGEWQRAADLRLWLDGYGITPKGQQLRRWRAPDASLGNGVDKLRSRGAYSALRAVPEDSS